MTTKSLSSGGARSGISVVVKNLRKTVLRNPAKNVSFSSKKKTSLRITSINLLLFGISKQCVNQLRNYIMLRQWHFLWYTMVSVVFSFLSLAWNITVLEKASKNKRSNENFSPKFTALTILLWQLSNLLSRLAAIVIFAYVFKGYVFAILGLHLVLINIAITIGRKSEICFFLTIICPNFSLVFHSSEAVLRWIRIELYPTILMNNVLIAFENIIMIILSVTVSKPSVPYMKIIGPTAASCALTGLVLSNIFFIVYSGTSRPGGVWGV